MTGMLAYRIEDTTSLLDARLKDIHPDLVHAFITERNRTRLAALPLLGTILVIGNCPVGNQLFLDNLRDEKGKKVEKLFNRSAEMVVRSGRPVWRVIAAGEIAGKFIYPAYRKMKGPERNKVRESTQGHLGKLASWLLERMAAGEGRGTVEHVDFMFHPCLAFYFNELHTQPMVGRRLKSCLAACNYLRVMAMIRKDLLEDSRKEGRTFNLQELEEEYVPPCDSEELQNYQMQLVYEAFHAGRWPKTPCQACGAPSLHGACDLHKRGMCTVDGEAAQWCDGCGGFVDPSVHAGPRAAKCRGCRTRESPCRVADCQAGDVRGACATHRDEMVCYLQDAPDQASRLGASFGLDRVCL
ncbi:hypothetical protein WJX72_001618 [[Myrmecia] bisecta]|uniref:Uncharacterized protein n=1 Tax=[Myrmecia] bisecta TaxID=41462 RepID=A0AAW1Q6J8_9CHLO